MDQLSQQPNKTLEGRVAVVTGGTRGIGLGVAKSLGQAGAKVALGYRSDDKAARAAETELTNLGLDVCSVKSDVGTRAGAQKLVEAAVNRWHRLDILVNNAGVLGWYFLEDMADEDFDEVFNSNFKSMVYCIQAALPTMKRQNYGRILNASSIAGRYGDVGQVAYSASKASCDTLTRIAAAELGPYGITVNAYAPGIIDTDMTRSMIEERGHIQIKQVPAGRFGSADDVAALLVFLSSEEASYITGEIIGVDGGMLKVQNPYRARER